MVELERVLSYHRGERQGASWTGHQSGTGRSVIMISSFHILPRFIFTYLIIHQSLMCIRFLPLRDPLGFFLYNEAGVKWVDVIHAVIMKNISA